MPRPMEVPHLADLDHPDLTVERPGEPWVVAVTFRADDGDSVTLTWDEVARSVALTWRDGRGDRLCLAREAVTKVSVHRVGGGFAVSVWSDSGGIAGRLDVRVTDRVSVEDTQLRG